MTKKEKDSLYKLLSQKFPKDRGFKSVSCQTDCGVTKKNMMSFGDKDNRIVAMDFLLRNTPNTIYGKICKELEINSILERQNEHS